MLKKYVGDRQFYKYVLAISLPIMLQNGITNFVNMLDNIMVGQIGTAQMNGVAVTNQLIFVFNLCVFGAASGAGIFGAQFYGKQDFKGMKYTFRFKLLLILSITVGAMALFFFGGGVMISQFLKGEGSPLDAARSLGFAKNYLGIMLIGLIPYAIAQCYASSLRETGETVLPMKAGLVAVIVNLVFNYILIFGHFGAPKMGVKGAAIATVMSRFVELLIVVIWTHCHSTKAPFILGVYRGFKIPFKLALEMFSKGVPLTVNEALWAAGIAMLNQCYSLTGLNTVSANNISQTFWNVFSVVFMAIGTSIGIIIGQQLGANEFEKAKDTDRKLIAFSLFTSVIVGVVYIGAAQIIPLAYNTTQDVRNLATGIMCISALFMPVSSFVHASYFTLRSGGQTMVTFLFDSCFMWCISVPVAFVLSRFTGIGILPLYAICQSLDIIKCVVGAILLKKGVWVKNIVAKA
jgi:putative MATE family efflux protein